MDPTDEELDQFVGLAFQCTSHGRGLRSSCVHPSRWWFELRHEIKLTRITSRRHFSITDRGSLNGCSLSQGKEPFYPPRHLNRVIRRLIRRRHQTTIFSLVIQRQLWPSTQLAGRKTVASMATLGVASVRLFRLGKPDKRHYRAKH
jgi:hypothetical protein